MLSDLPLKGAALGLPAPSCFARQAKVRDSGTARQCVVVADAAAGIGGSPGAGSMWTVVLVPC